MGLTLAKPRPAPVPMPPARLTSCRYWEDWQPEYLHAIHAALTRVIDEKERQGDLFTAPRQAPAAAPQDFHNEAQKASLLTTPSASEKNATLGMRVGIDTAQRTAPVRRSRHFAWSIRTEVLRRERQSAAMALPPRHSKRTGCQP